MKYIYKNVTLFPATVQLATRNQDYVSTIVLVPGAVKELDYPGLNLYVPNILSCYTIDVEAPVVPVVEPVELEISIPVVEDVFINPPVTEEVGAPIEELHPVTEEDETPEIPKADPELELVPPPSPSIEIVKSGKPVNKNKPSKKN